MHKQLVVEENKIPYISQIQYCAQDSFGDITYMTETNHRQYQIWGGYEIEIPIFEQQLITIEIANFPKNFKGSLYLAMEQGDTIYTLWEIPPEAIDFNNSPLTISISPFSISSWVGTFNRFIFTDEALNILCEASWVQLTWPQDYGIVIP